MNDITCQAVEEQLELVAAGECDPQTQEAVEQHLERCQACASSYAKSQRLLGLIDLHFSEAGPATLRQRIDLEEQRTRRWHFLTPTMSRVASLAAMVLVAVGLVWGLLSWQPQESQPDLQLAAVFEPQRSAEPKMTRAQALVGPAEHATDSTDRVFTLTLPRAQTGPKYRKQLEQDRREGKLPSPSKVPLELRVTNSGSKPLVVRFDDPLCELLLDVRGEGLVHEPAPRAPEPAFMNWEPLRLEPGEHVDITIDKLIAGSRGHLQYIYLTEPTEYRLMARIRVRVGSKVLTIGSKTLRLKVEALGL